jgi:putative hydrolase of the HAD superfamily
VGDVPSEPEAAGVILDVGGVLLGPDRDLLARRLAAAGIVVRTPVPADLHHRAVAAFERGRGDEVPHDIDAGYRSGLVLALGVADGDRELAAAVLDEAFEQPAHEVWRDVLPGAREGLAALAARGLALAVVSNADGTVAAQLREHRLAQVGPGPGVELVALVDSHHLGVRKPDPAVFAPAVAALGLPPGRCLYVGDTLTYDVVGALAAGLVPVHLDPVGWCRGDHRHVRWLDDLAASIRTGP